MKRTKILTKRGGFLTKNTQTINIKTFHFLFIYSHAKNKNFSILTMFELYYSFFFKD